MEAALTWILVGAGGAVAFGLAQLVYLGAVLAGTDRDTERLAYYGLPPAERAAFRQRLAGRARRLRPVLYVLGRFSKFTFERASFEARGIYGPRGTCRPESFASAFEYEPRPDDVFVVTQMKSGTTWMQHLVYEVLERGGGDLVSSGTALCAVSPWLESTKSVPVDEAPPSGSERPGRVIKTHLPATHCPRSPEARYVYVARHPASCFASCVDFIAANAGSLTPALEDIEAWFCSNGMWWTPWPDHVAGWWDRSTTDANVLFVHFEDMVDDLAAVARRVAVFLGLDPLSDRELANVVEKCGFEYMKGHAEAFEMHPPHLFSTESRFFVRGTADRHADVPVAVRERILTWCADGVDGRDYPMARYYPDVASAGGPDATGSWSSQG